MKKLSFINKLIYIVNSLVATLLLLSYILPYISPKSFPIFAIISLLAPILILINIAFVVYWIISLKKQFILSTVVLTIGWFLMPNIYKFTEKSSSLNDDLKVMSYNVRTFNYLRHINKHITTDTIKKIIKKVSPHILLLQENLKRPSNYIPNYPYNYFKSNGGNKNIGLVVYSKYKIINQGSLDLKNTSNNIIFVDILRKKDTVRIYNLHLQSLLLQIDKENFGKENSEKLVSELKASFKKQAEQVETFLAHQKQWKGKLIVCGDFNNTSYSWVYNQIAKNKKDAFIEAGKGFGKSFDYWFPIRIDYILTDENAVVNKFTTFSEKYSDHFPILAKINW